MEVYAKYDAEEGDFKQVVSSITSALFGAFSPKLLEAQKQVFSNSLSGIPAVAFSDDNSAPRGYLNCIFFNKSLGYVQQNAIARQITTNANGTFEKLEIEKVIEEEGYLYIYVANESTADVDVFFDDLKVTHIESTVRSHADYYAFGYTIAGLSGESAGTNPNKYLYNGKELQDDAFGEIELGMYDYGARFYDPLIGRWNEIDPASEEENQESWSPYHYVQSNPIRYNDPDGRLSGEPGVDNISNGQVGAALGVEILEWKHSFENTILSLVGSDYRAVLVEDEEGNYDTDLIETDLSFGQDLKNFGIDVLNVVSLGKGGPTLGLFAKTPAKTAIVNATKNAVHANSKASTKIQHGYRIKDAKGKILEYGISSQKLNKSGTSPRINQKINTKYKGVSGIRGEVVKKNIAGRQKGLNWEKGKVNAYKNANTGGKKPPRQLRP
jgi:RHS repeat-associated protein